MNICTSRSQLFDGLDKEGKEIVNEQGGKYSPTTVRIKQEKGQPTDRVTLRDTGDWQNAAARWRNEFHDSLKD